MSWLARLLGNGGDKTPPHVLVALDTAAEAEKALAAAHAAVEASRTAKGKGRLDALADDYRAADELRGSK